MAGESLGQAGVIKMQNPGMLLDVQLSKGASFQQHVPAEWNGFAYVYTGAGAARRTQASVLSISSIVVLSMHMLPQSTTNGLLIEGALINCLRCHSCHAGGTICGQKAVPQHALWG